MLLLGFEMSVLILILTFVLLTGSIQFMNVDVAYGQTEDSQFLDFSTLLQRETIEKILNYCYEHADRTNPVQDLLNQGLISQDYNGKTCGSIKLTYDKILDYIGR